MEIIMNQDMSAVKKRKKPTLVCENCKRKKIKCDKLEPCTQCTKSNLMSSCSYSVGTTKKAKLPYMQSAKEPIRFDSGNQAKRTKSNLNEQHVHAPTHVPPAEDTVSISISQLAQLQEKVSQLESMMKSQVNNNSISHNNSTSPNTVLPPIETPESMSSYRSKPSPAGSQFSVPSVESTHTFASTPNNVSKLLNKTDVFHPNAFSFTQLPGKLKRSIQDMQALIGVHPYDSKTDFISFYEGYSSMHVKDENRTINFGPLAWPSIMNKDPGLHALWETISNNVSSGQSFLTAAYDDVILFRPVGTSIPNNSETTFRKKAMEDDGHEVYTPYTSKNTFKKAYILDLQHQDLPSTKSDEELPLIEKIRRALPNKRVIWTLVNRFFSHQYLLAPYLEEDNFRESLAELIGPESMLPETIEVIKITKKLDLTQLGILFVIMRLTYLTYLYNKTAKNIENKTSTDPDLEAQEIRLILTNPIGNESTKLAQAIFEQFQSVNQITVPMIQLVIYIKIISYYDPIEADQAGTQTQTLDAVILQMAYVLGLNREPDSLSGALPNQTRNNLRRKLWCIVLLWDVNSRMKLGSPLMISHRGWDTRYPFHAEGNENIRNHALDRHVTDFYGKSVFLSPALDRILDQVLDISARANVAQLCGDLSVFENEVYREFVSLGECLKLLPSNRQQLDFFPHFGVKHFITRKQFLQSIYFHLYLFYEYRDHKLSFFYLKKMLLITCGDFMPSYFEIFDNDKICGDMILNPAMLNFIDKANLVFQSIIIRANYKIYKMRKLDNFKSRYETEETFRSYYQKVCKFSSYLIRCIELSLNAIGRLSHRYYHAWRIVKAHIYSAKIIGNEPFYQLLESSPGTSKIRGFALDEIEELTAVCEIALDALNPMMIEQDKLLYRMSVNEFEQEPDDQDATQQDDQKKQVNINENFSEMFDSREIDTLWLQMLNKNIYQPSETVDNGLNGVETSIDNKSTQDPQVELFNDLTFDQIFNYGNA